jgi:ligand-binding sensor domain-containing protein/serine phosphatase RsbU (regulator of sigma subunit)
MSILLQRVCSVLFLLTMIVPEGAAQDISFDHISVEKGLLSTSVYTITQSDDGFLWIGTQNGLNQYDGYNFRTFTYSPNASNGLANNWIQALLADNEGNLWVGTSNGLSRFDRNTEKFHNYFSDSLDPGSIADNTIWSIFQSSDSAVWIGTNNGLCRYNKAKDSFEIFKAEPPVPGMDVFNAIDAIAEDKDGNLWVGTWGSGIAKLDKEAKKLKLQALDQQGKSRLSNTRVKTIKFDKDGVLWIGTHGGGINTYDPATHSLFVYQHEESSLNSLSNNVILSLYEDKRENIWVGTYSGGLNKLDAKTGIITRFMPDPLNKSAIHGKWITSVFEDAAGNIWLGHENGLSRFSVRGPKFLHYKPEPRNPNSIPQSNINSIYEDSDGLIWFGLWGEGLTSFDRKTNTFSHYDQDKGIKAGLKNSRIWDIAEDSQEQLWVGTSGGLYILDKRTGNLISFDKTLLNKGMNFYRNVSILAFDRRRNSMWIGTWGGGLYLYSLDTKQIHHFKSEAGVPDSLSGNRIKYIFIDSKGALWIATSEAGLNKLTLDEKGKVHVEYFMYNAEDERSLGSNSPMVIYEDSQKRIWVGTSGGGLNLLNAGSREFSRFFPDQEQRIISVYGILEDKQGNLWLSTNYGLSKFNPVSGKFKNYDVSDGLQSTTFLYGHCKSKDGAMWFGGHNGFNVFFPEEIKDSEFMPPIVLNDLRIFNEPVPVGQGPVKPVNHQVALTNPLHKSSKITLNYHDHVLSFGFAALDFTAPHKNKYAYKLDNFDGNWNYTDAGKRYATYTNLEPGEYTFKVKATNSDGVWNEQHASIKVIVSPPLWLTWWFKSLTILLLIGSVAGTFKYRIYKVEEKKKALEDLVIRRTAEITSQKEEILTQRDYIAQKNNSLQQAYSEIALKNMDITSSLKYALRIQQALLPQETLMRNAFNDLFILFKPRDVVSGDFFWFSRKGNNIYIAVVDCTGHGVPGAFMSILGHGIINQILQDKCTTNPAEVLTLMQEEVNRVLRQDESSNHDGMDVAFCVIDTLEQTLTYAGARSPLYYVEHGELHIIKGNQYPIGGFVKDRGYNVYSSHTISLVNNPSFYLFTDGYRDQLGGEKGKKYLGKRFRNIIEQVSYMPMADQQVMLENELARWTDQKFEQTDDILVLGFKM